MDGVTSLVIECGEESTVMSATVNSRFSDIIQVVCGKWSHLSESGFFLRYNAASIVNCCLDSDAEFGSMLIVAQQLGLRLIKVVVKPKGVLGHPHIESSQNVVNVDKCSSEVNNVYQESFNNVAARAFSATIGANNSPNRGNNNTKKNVPAYEKHDSLPTFDVCPRQKEKYLLSDPWETIITGIGQEFPGGAKEFRTELAKYSTINGFKYTYQQNNRQRIYVVCAKRYEENKCDWFIRVSEVKGGTGEFSITNAELNHTCEGVLGAHETKRLGAELIASLIESEVREKPTFSGAEVKRLIKNAYGIDITYKKAWRGLELVRNKIFGSFGESFNQLGWYLQALLKTNPGSHVLLVKSCDTGRFEKAFVAFKATIEGFKHCRPMLFVDGTFMRGRWKGTILAATAKDGNDGLFSVAFAMVQGETTENWKWFLKQLRDNVKHEKQIYYISDRNTGLLSAFPKVFDKPIHFFCLVHLFKNLKGQYGQGWNEGFRIKMCGLLKRCAYAPTPRLFEQEMAEFLKVGGPIAQHWIKDIDPKKWSVAFAPHILRYGEMTSNAAESFNHWIKEARALPITYMLDCIRIGMMRWFVGRREAADKWTSTLTAGMQTKWNKHAHICKHWGVLKCPNGKFEVKSIPNAEVDIERKSCTCYQWQVVGFPCVHVVAVIRKHYNTVAGVILPYYTKASYKATYQSNIMAVPETLKYEVSNLDGLDKILPPEKVVELGRNKQKRIPSFDEYPRKKPWLCNICKKVGRHDEVTCAQANGV